MVLLVVVMPREYDMYNNRRMFFYIKAPNLNCDSGMKKKYDCYEVALCRLKELAVYF